MALLIKSKTELRNDYKKMIKVTTSFLDYELKMKMIFKNPSEIAS